MDRKCKQKVTVMFLCVLGAFLILTVLGIGFEEASQMRREQQQELGILYPELEVHLSENFSFYQSRIMENGLLIGAAVLVIFLFTIGLTVWYLKRASRKEWETERRRRELLYEQLGEFWQGNFSMLPSWDCLSEMGDWEPIYDKLRELSYAMSDMRARIQEEENSTKALITDISHQLKTPLASIRMCHELAESGDLKMEEQEDFRATETREIEKMEMLLEELVKLSRLENNMIQIHPKIESLEQTLSEAVGQIYMKAHKKNIELSVDMEEEVSLLHDRKWTVEALVNILDNGVKYSKDNTEIQIAVKSLAGSVLIEIADQGIGIPEEEYHAVFQRFYRGEQAKKMAKEGAGVGLYLTRIIIERQGGSIVAKKNPGRGTVFKIMLPRS